LRKAGATEAVEFSRAVDARFIGQGSETNLPIPSGDFTSLTPADIRKRFDETYTHLYGRTYPESAIEFVNFRVRASLPMKLLDLPRLTRTSGKINEAIKGERKAFSGVARDFIPFTVYNRYKFFAGATFSGPAIIEERESTVIVGEEAKVSVDEYGFLWIEL
jgi:N-methylhydantoinase A